MWGHGSLAPSPSLQWLHPCKFQLFWFSPTANYNRCVWSRPVKSCCATESLPVFIDFFRYPDLPSFSLGIRCCLFWINLWFKNYFIRFTKRILLTPVLSLFFNKVRGWSAANIVKWDSGTGAFLWILFSFTEHLFVQHLLKAVSVIFFLKSYYVKSCETMKTSDSVTM